MRDFLYPVIYFIEYIFNIYIYIYIYISEHFLARWNPLQISCTEDEDNVVDDFNKCVHNLLLTYFPSMLDKPLPGV